MSRIRFVRAMPAMAILSISSQRAVVERDIDRWVLCLNADNAGFTRNQQMAWLLAKFPEFRNLFHHRLNTGSRAQGILAKLIYKGEASLKLETKHIGPGLFIQHGFATIVAAERIGRDCWINQQVTVGHVFDRGAPTIGDNVTIAAGSQVVGPVVVGDGATIGAGVTITKDVPPGATAVGLGFRILPVKE